MSNEQQQPSDRAIAQAVHELEQSGPTNTVICMRDITKRAAAIDAEAKQHEIAHINGCTFERVTSRGDERAIGVPSGNLTTVSAHEKDHRARILFEVADRMLLAAPAELPDGFVLVPREPTPEMIRAALEAPISGHPETGSVSASDVYAAMLAAAPKPQETRHVGP